ncbi:MAG: hypothetical protein CVT88_00735 [Candidatus Altiarchaeales archaeon HGW-Altiarchaeales-1]|nr:MAG: hypothetical protein CVT88_00735 [Candidatus Altiarchaeales archaeon HGW-Altiarchaeales-1]
MAPEEVGAKESNKKENINFSEIYEISIEDIWRYAKLHEKETKEWIEKTEKEEIETAKYARNYLVH